MKRSTRLRVAAGAIGLGIVGCTGGVALAGNSANAPVTVDALTGTRSLNLLNLSGGQLSGVTMGIGHTGGFVANVTDTAYQNSGYQVTAEMSNLYKYDATSQTYDFNSDISSGQVHLSFPSANPLDLTDVGSVVTPVIALSGDLSGVLSGLGLGGLTGVVTTIPNDTTVDGTAQTVQNLANEIVNGVANDLPIQLKTGDAGDFDSDGPMTGVTQANTPAGSASPTQLVLMQGSANGVGTTLNNLLTELNNQLNLGNNPTLQQVVNAGLLSKDDALADVQEATGIPLATIQANANAILGAVTAQVTSLANVLGQTGSYNSLPLLSVNVPSNTPSGTYQGIMTVTLMDTP